MEDRKKMKKGEKIRGFNSKGYFHMVEPYCEEYLKAKHAVFEKSKKMRQQKQNDPMMFQFNQPKSGYYALKGCNVDVLKDKFQKNYPQTKNHQSTKKCNSQFLNNFLKKYAERKLKLQNKQKSQIALPVMKNINVFTQPCETEQPIHSKSMFIIQMQKGSKKILRMPRNRLRTQIGNLSLENNKRPIQDRKTVGSLVKVKQNESKDTI